MKPRSPFILALFVVFLLLLPLSPGLHIASFISLTLVAMCKRERLGGGLTLAITIILALLIYTSGQVLFPPETDNRLLAFMLGFEKPVMLIIFTAVLYFTYPKRISSLAGIVSLTAILLLIEELVVVQLLSAFPVHSQGPPAGNPYLDFSPGRENFELVVEQARSSAKKINSEINTQIFNTSIENLARFQATLNTIMCSLYALFFTRFFSRFFLGINFDFITFRLATSLFYFLISVWAILLLLFQLNISLPHQLMHTMYSTLLTLSFLFFLQGMAVVSFKIRRWGRILKRAEKTPANAVGGNMFIRPQWGRVGYFALLLLIPLLFIGNPIAMITLPIAIALTGMLDLWFDYRKLR